MVSSGRKKKNRRLAVLIAVFAVVLILALTALQALRDDLELTGYEVSLENLPQELDGYKILLVADLHSERFGEEQTELLVLANSTGADLTVLCGDIPDSTNYDLLPIQEFLSELECSNVLAVYGNHENGVTYFDRKDLAELYSANGVQLLVDSSAILNHNGTDFSVSGMNDPGFWGKGDLEYVTENPPAVTPEDGMFNILLCHRANLYPAISGLGFDLILSGHLHGGQVRIPFVGGLISPSREFFPDYTGGVYDDGDSVMIVSRGLGNVVDFPRIFNPPELVLVTLRSTQ
ncbi:MAG: metallophosphoesterase [Clostridia bacterium]|nr:metallophosphoesterase [Clostridia bacterium]